jgi:hypothetical protein
MPPALTPTLDFPADAGDRSRTGSARQSLTRAGALIRQDRAVYLLIAAHMAAAAAALIATGQSASFAYLPYLSIWPFVFFLYFPFVYLLIGTFQVIHRFDERRRLAFGMLFSPSRIGHLLGGLGLLAALMIFQGSFTSLKNAFPAWHGGFPFDAHQADLDRLLLFGHEPWRLLYAFSENGIARLLVEWNYDHGWFILCYAALFWIAVAPEASRIRTRYMLTYVAVWIVVGNLLAGLLLSAGPAFYGQVTGDHARFAAQLAFLDGSGDHDYSARTVQRYLWALFSSGRPGIGSGISAFPSVHVATAMLNALFIWEWNRRYGLVAFVYTGLIALSSVYLAWHYAIDSYVAIAVTIGLFFIIRRWMGGAAAGTRL